MSKRLFPFLLTLLPILGFLAFPALGQAALTVDPDTEVIIAGKVTSATDTDKDGKNDTFVINTGGSDKTVSNKTETKDMGLIAVGDHVEIKVKVTDTGNTIVDVIKIGE
jgi:hypothetical protein